MEKRAGIIVSPGCEEGETLTIVDILRRAEITCDMFGLNSLEVTGAHDITMLCDKVLNEELKDYDMVILPGGYGGTEAMADTEVLRDILKEMNEAGRYVTAICAAPYVLYKSGILENRTFTCYPTFAEKITEGTRKNEAVVTDGNLITSQGPATAWAFAYTLVDALGGDSETVKNRMVYYNAFDVKEAE